MKRRKPGLNASGRAVGGSHGDAPLSDKCHQIIVKDKRRKVLSIGATESPKMRGLPEENGYFYLYAFLCRTGVFAGPLAFFRGGVVFLHPTHFPSTRIFASEPVRQLGFSGENPKRDPQVMSGTFENFPTEFSWGIQLFAGLKCQPVEYPASHVWGFPQTV